MTKRTGFLLAAGMIIIGFGLAWFGSWRRITIFINGQPENIRTHAITIRAALDQADIEITPLDRVSPQLGSILGWHGVIAVERSSEIWVEQNPPGYSVRLTSAERIPANLLFAAGIPLFPGDQVAWQGIIIHPEQRLPYKSNHVLQVVKAIPITIDSLTDSRILYSSAGTLGAALWHAGYPSILADDISIPLDRLLNGPITVALQAARPITIQVDGMDIQSLTSAKTVGEALNESGIALAGLDQSIPAEDQQIPENGIIRLKRVREEFLLEQTVIPFEVVYVADPNTELDQQSIVEAGQYGVQVNRQRIRYEDGVEVGRQTEAEWTASDPVTKKVGYGTKVVVRTLDTPSGPIEYWRAITVYATAYSPCRSGTTKCYYGTSYGLPVRRGVIGVTRAWYNLMAGQGVYVPGYGKGIIADTGGGIPGKYWIDLGFTDEDFEAWHQDVTLYFLTPVPADIPWILP